MGIDEDLHALGLLNLLVDFLVDGKNSLVATDKVVCPMKLLRNFLKRIGVY